MIFVVSKLDFDISIFKLELKLLLTLILKCSILDFKRKYEKKLSFSYRYKISVSEFFFHQNKVLKHFPFNKDDKFF